MRRLRPRSLRDKIRLSELLDLYLRTLLESPLQVTLRRLSYDTGIPERILCRLASLYFNPADETQIRLEDYYIVFANIQFRYPTVKMYECSDGAVFFKL
jgi:hypothetical protein